MEYNHLEELGFSEDKQLLCTASGLLCSGNAMKRMCDRFIRNGGRIYDVLMAYDNILSYGLDRDDRKSGDSFKTLVPLLKAAGVTDTSLHDHFSKDMGLMPGSGIIHHFSKMMTTEVVSETYVHHAIALCDSLDVPLDIIRCTELSFDALEMDRLEAKKFRDIAAYIAKMDVPKVSSNNGIHYIGPKDQMTIGAIDDMIETMNETDFYHQLEEIRPVGGNEKAFALMDMKRGTNVDLDCTAYIGNNGTDYPSLDIVRDNDGLAMSFNGDAYAVKGSNIAVMSQNAIVAAVIVSEFYAGGIERVYSMLNSWTCDKLSRYECSDRYLMNALLTAFPSRLPDVVIVNKDNLEDVTRESERFRRKLTV